MSQRRRQVGVFGRAHEMFLGRPKVLLAVECCYFGSIGQLHGVGDGGPALIAMRQAAVGRAKHIYTCYLLC
jgi:hypothetical protein